jgi:hypothetical protein
MNMTVEEIVKKFLTDNGFDGLFNVDGDCACPTNFLAPCGEISNNCEPGYRVEGCTCGQGCDYHIVRDKPDGGKMNPAEEWGPDKSHAPDCTYRLKGECTCPKSKYVEEEPLTENDVKEENLPELTPEEKSRVEKMGVNKVLKLVGIHRAPEHSGRFGAVLEAVNEYSRALDEGPHDTCEEGCIFEDLFLRLAKIFLSEEKMREKYRIADWQYEVNNGDTVLGYEEWVKHKTETEHGS